MGNKKGGATPNPPQQSQQSQQQMAAMLSMAKSSGGVSAAKPPPVPQPLDPPKVAKVENVDWQSKTENLRNKARARTLAEINKRHGRKATMHGSLVEDDYGGPGESKIPPLGTTDTESTPT